MLLGFGLHAASVRQLMIIMIEGVMYLGACIHVEITGIFRKMQCLD